MFFLNEIISVLASRYFSSVQQIFIGYFIWIRHILQGSEDIIINKYCPWPLETYSLLGKTCTEKVLTYKIFFTCHHIESCKKVVNIYNSHYWSWVRHARQYWWPSWGWDDKLVKVSGHIHSCVIFFLQEAKKVNYWIHLTLGICRLVRLKGWGNEDPDTIGTHAFPKNGTHARLVLGSQEILFVSPDPDSASGGDVLVFCLDSVHLLERQVAHRRVVIAGKHHP